MTLALGDHESRLITLGSLIEPPNPSRSAMDDEKLAELANSIARIGLKQHLIVVPVGDRFEIIAGHRRFFAAQRAGRVAVPCDVYPNRDDANEAAQYAENRFREELTPADEALWFADTAGRKFDGDTDKLAAYLHERRDYVEGRINLLRGDMEVFEALRAGKIKIGVAEELNKCTDESYRRMYLHQAIQGGATRAVVTGWIAEWKAVHAPANRNSAPSDATVLPTPIPQTEYFRCLLCKKTDNVHAMRAVNMHDYCIAAQLDDMLALYTRRGDFVRRPRTQAEAAELINTLADEFLLATQEDPRRV